MNPWQMSQQIKHLLERVRWPQGAAEVVFGAKGGVRVFAGEPTAEHIPPNFPFALVGIKGGVPDTDDPNLIVQTFTIMSVVAVRGDPTGENAIIGGPVAAIGTSKGRGSAEVSSRARSAVQDLTGADGAPILVSSTQISTPTVLQGRHIVVEEFDVTVLCTSDLYYTEPQELGLSGTTWTWTHDAAQRHDFVQYKLGYVSGSDPATSPESATIVYTGADPTTSHSGGAGRAYSVWAQYSSRKSTGTVEGSSDGTLVGAFLVT